MLRLVVFIPAYNEEEKITAVVTAINEQRLSLSELKIELHIIVIDDGSNDKTYEIANNLDIDKIVKHHINKGLGAAVRTGLITAKSMNADIAVKIDADLQHDPSDIIPLIEPIIEGESDIVYGNRFEKISYQMPFIRKYGNIVFIKLMRFLTGWPLKDSQPGIFAVNKNYLSNFRIPGDYNYTQQILLDAYHKGMRFEHVSVSFHKRETGKSFVTLKYPIKVIYQILMVLCTVKPMKVFVPISLLFLLPATGLFFTEIFLWVTDKTPKPIMHVNALLGLLIIGLQTFFFGLLAEIIVELNTKNNQ